MSKWEAAMIANLRGMWSMAGGVKCDDCGYSNTFQVTQASARLVDWDSSGNEALQFETEIRCDICGNECHHNWTIKQGDFPEGE